MARAIGIDAEKIRTAIGAHRFPVTRIVQDGARARLCDCAGEEAAVRVRDVLIENCVRIAPLVGDRGALIPVGPSPGELPALCLPRRPKV